MRLLLLALALALAACADPVDGQLLSAAPYMEAGGSTVHDVTYASGGLRIRGMVAIPAGEGPFPLVWFNHGGFHGMGDAEIEGLGARATALGAVVAASMYRGEGGSEGDIEYCLGEVDDVLHLGAAAAELAPLTPARAAIGFSHGACVSLMVNDRMHALETPLLHTVALGTPTEVDVLIDWHRTEGDPEHAARWEPYVNGEDGREMSPLYAEMSPPLTLLHGMEDPIVPLQQACLLRDELSPAWPVADHRLDASLSPLPAQAVPDCQQAVAGGAPFAPVPDGLRLISIEGAAHVPRQDVWDLGWGVVQDALEAEE